MPQDDSLQIALDRLSHSARQLYDHWAAAFQFGAGNSSLSHAEQQCRRNIDAAERIVEQSLAMQSRWLKFGRELVDAAAANQPALSLCQQPLQLCEQLLRHRSEAWRQCFASARRLDFKLAERALEEARAHTVFSTWSEVSQQALEQRIEWLRAVLPPSPASAASEPEQAEPTVARKSRTPKTSARSVAA